MGGEASSEKTGNFGVEINGEGMQKSSEAGSSVKNETGGGSKVHSDDGSSNPEPDNMDIDLQEETSDKEGGDMSSVARKESVVNEGSPDNGPVSPHGQSLP